MRRSNRSRTSSSTRCGHGSCSPGMPSKENWLKPEGCGLNSEFKEYGICGIPSCPWYPPDDSSVSRPYGIGACVRENWVRSILFCDDKTGREKWEEMLKVGKTGKAHPRRQIGGIELSSAALSRGDPRSDNGWTLWILSTRPLYLIGLSVRCLRLVFPTPVEDLVFS